MIDVQLVGIASVVDAGEDDLQLVVVVDLVGVDGLPADIGGALRFAQCFHDVCQRDVLQLIVIGADIDDLHSFIEAKD